MSVAGTTTITFNPPFAGIPTVVLTPIIASGTAVFAEVEALSPTAVTVGVLAQTGGYRAGHTVYWSATD